MQVLKQNIRARPRPGALLGRKEKHVSPTSRSGGEGGALRPPPGVCEDVPAPCLMQVVQLADEVAKADRKWFSRGELDARAAEICGGPERGVTLVERLMLAGALTMSGGLNYRTQVLAREQCVVRMCGIAAVSDEWATGAGGRPVSRELVRLYGVTWPADIPRCAAMSPAEAPHAGRVAREMRRYGMRRAEEDDVLDFCEALVGRRVEAKAVLGMLVRRGWLRWAGAFLVPTEALDKLPMIVRTA